MTNSSVENALRDDTHDDSHPDSARQNDVDTTALDLWDQPADSDSVIRKLESGGTPGRTDEARTRPLSVDEIGADINVTDLDDPRLFLNRELTWLSFNERVLNEARDMRNPLLERVKFLAIVGSNIDEFFMKRIGGLKLQHAAGVRSLTVDGRRPAEQIAAAYASVIELEQDIEKLVPALIEELAGENIDILDYEDLPPDDRLWMRQYYLQNVFPLVTPQSVDPTHPFPFVSNLSLNLLVTLREPKVEEIRVARVKVPTGKGINRFVAVRDTNQFVHLSSIISNNLDLLFPTMEILDCERFHVTRNANVARDQEDADDLMELIESELRDRKLAPIVRLVVSRTMNEFSRNALAANLRLDAKADLFDTSSIIPTSDLMELVSLARPELKFRPHTPIDSIYLDTGRDIFQGIREAGSVLLHHPYESFSTSVERFVSEASCDHSVLAIKMTLYRTGRHSKIIDYLIEAAQNGKQVTVVVELKARFDEAANLRWASRLEEAGIHVTYGIVGLKTHCKTILVIRREGNLLKRYMHIGTGNYHAVTARQYSDMSMFTVDEEIGQDLTELFNYLTTGFVAERFYRSLLVAPSLIKTGLIKKIRREASLARAGNDGLIRFKLNALEDSEITRELYRASLAGVRVQLIIRDTCRLRPGIRGLSDNIEVISIVGRFLEHTRIYYFANSGSPEIYIGSADAMTRNLEHRVEVLVPIESAHCVETIDQLLETQLTDCRSAWDMYADGSYRQRQGALDAVGTHDTLINQYDRVTNHNNRKAHGYSRSES